MAAGGIPVGVPVIYAAPTLSLAVLEILVHFSVLPKGYVYSEIRIPDHLLIEHVTDDKLPANWDALTPVRETQTFGARWTSELRSPVLSVPSSIIHRERNLVINPAHPEFSEIEFSPPNPFHFDPRLK